MNDMYAIKTTTLTALGDSIRGKFTDATKLVEEPVISKNGDPVDSTQLYSKFKHTYCQEGDNIYVVKIPGAVNITVNTYTYSSTSANSGLNIAPGELETVPHNTIYKKTESGWQTFKFTNTDAVTFNYHALHPQDFRNSEDETVYGYYAECYAEIPNTMTPIQMSEVLNAFILPEGPTDEDLTITGNCNYKFANGGWDWFINKYGSRITTNNITNSSQMFSATNLEYIPFELNLGNVTMNYMFANAKKLKELPKINNAIPTDTSYFAQNCAYLQSIPQDYFDTWDWSKIDGSTSSYSADTSHMFAGCSSLRSFPTSVFAHGNPVVYASYGCFADTFNGCYALDEIVGMPNPHYGASYTSSGYSGLISSNFVSNCSRLKRFTFADGITAKWSNQTLDLSYYVGWGMSLAYFTGSSYQAVPFTTATQVVGADTYAALKDNPDYWTTNVKYSRYNRLSAIETLNSLPDTSATGTNTIKFKGEAGELTDGGMIMALTADEIAGAAAKGWTVAFV